MVRVVSLLNSNVSLILIYKLFIYLKIIIYNEIQLYAITFYNIDIKL